MDEEVFPQVRLDPNSEHVSPVSDYEMERRLKHKGNDEYGHHHEEYLKGVPGQHVVHSSSRHQRESQVYA